MTVKRLDALTALRFPAALAVFGWHASTHLTLTGPAAVPLRAGPLGVSFFYVLSGFVLMWSLRQDDDARNFYIRRIARIGPAYWATVGLVLVLLAIGGIYSTPHGPGRLLPVVTLTQAWIPDPGHYFAISPPLWSLSCEAFFYALFPLLGPRIAALTQPARWRLMAALVASITVLDVATWAAVGTSTIKAQNSIGFWLVYICPPTRLAEFLLGAAVAASVRFGNVRAPLSLRPAALLAVMALLVAGALPTSLAAIFIVAVPFALLLAAGAQTTATIPATLIRLGEWSFAFYLLHVLVLATSSHWLPFSASASVMVVLALLMTVVAAGALHEVVERPAERWLRHRFAHAPERVTAA